MHVDRELFMEQGFLILRNVVPRDQLVQLRWHFETALEAQKLLWAKEAGPDDPPGGLWEKSGMPTLGLDLVVDFNQPGLRGSNPDRLRCQRWQSRKSES